MNHDLNVDEMIEHFTLLPTEIHFLGRNDPRNHLGKAFLLKFFQHEYRFPENKSEVPQIIIEYLAQQLDLPAEVIRVESVSEPKCAIEKG